jgi:photosystem II stability/assembly factor-like uncharacterized protein
MSTGTPNLVTEAVNARLLALILCLGLWTGQGYGQDRNISEPQSSLFWSQRQNGNSEDSAASLRLHALQQSQCLPVLGGPWTEVGPRPFFGINPITRQPDETMSGQVSAIAVDLAHDPRGNLVYVGSSSGGLWKSTNGLGANPSFVPLSDQTESLSVGAIALDTRTNPPTIYVGTGAPDNSANISSYTGVGILISADGGQTWRRVASADNGAHPFVGQGFSSVLIDPVNPNILMASTGLGIDYNFPHCSIPQGDGAFQHLGIYRSADAGNTWTRAMSTNYGPTPPSSFYHTDLLYEPTQGTYFAGVSQQGFFASSDRGATWQSFQALDLGQGLPGPTQILRVSLATRNGTLWALVLRPPAAPSAPQYFELFQSDDHARSWRQISSQVLISTCRMPQGLQPLPIKGYLMYVAAPPDSNALLLATDCIYRKDNIQDQSSSFVEIEGNLHGDQHAIAFVDANRWYVGDDGGAWATTHRGDRWISLNQDLRTLEFFSADEDSAGSGSYAGGMQDNGPAFTTAGPAWRQFVPGDGMYVAADPRNSGAFFMSEQNGNIFYVPISSPANTKQIIQLSARPPQGLGFPADFLTPYEILPTDPRLYNGVTGFPGFNFGRSRILLTGANNPWLVAFDPDAPSNNTASVRLTSSINSVINYIAPAPGDPTTAYLTAGSALYRLSNISFAGIATVTSITGGPVNGNVLGHLAVSPARSGTLYLIKVGFLAGQKIFKSENGGGTWINISGNMPNTPLNWITVDPANPDFIFVAGDTGVFVATDGGVEDEQWQRLGSGLPNVPVVQTKILPARKLIAATYGRNVWTLDISHLEEKPALQYAVKFVCGKSEGGVVAPGTYFTAVNVHNPREKAVAFRKKFAIALPGEKPGPVSKFFTAKLCPDEALEIDCPDILSHAQGQNFLKGFVVIETPSRLDVVAAYTAAGSTGSIETLFIERVSGQPLTQPPLPDLVPVNPQPSSGASGFCRLVGGRLVVTVRNQGVAPAGASQTTVNFAGVGPVSVNTPPIPAGGSADVVVSIPSTCFVGTECRFHIVVDSALQVEESNEDNNTADGLCMRPS